MVKNLLKTVFLSGKKLSFFTTKDPYNDNVYCKCGHEMYQHSPLGLHGCWICNCKKFIKEETLLGG